MSSIRRTTRFARAAFACLACGVATAALAQSLSSTGVRAVPTYEAVGLYWSSPGASSAAGCDVRYRKQGESAWSNGLALWFDAASNECRGSVVGLAPGATYEAQLGLSGSFTRAVTFATWPNQFPVARVVPVAAGSATLDITAGGTPGGYVVYDGGGAVLDAKNAAQHNVTINASYVIVRNLVLKGAMRDAIRVSPNVTDVVIEDTDISGWGRTRDGKWGTDMDSGIRAVCAAETLTRLTVQRNRIHDPRYPANSWSDGHPEGPQGISLSYCGGNNVYRWNEIYSAQNHFNDAMGGEDNFSTTGFPNKDSDIYGNRIEMAWDDGIEAEGGNRNVRIWGNYLNNTAIGIATTATAVGPVYVFRNVYNRSRFYEKSAPDADDRGPMFKSGSSPDFGNGRRYLFHNTLLQATQAGLQYPLGAGAGIGGTGATQLVRNTLSMNNIYHTWKGGSAVYQVGSDNTFRNDMFNGRFDTAIVGGINATPSYASGSGWQSEAGGMYQLAAGSPGYDGGVRIANFNDGFAGAAPDVGAAEASRPGMKFGLAAASAPTTPPPPSATGADLAITQSFAGTASTGKDLVVTLTATNNGPAAASAVSVTQTLPAGWAFVWASPGCANASGTVTCGGGALAVGASVQVKVVARPSAAGAVTSVARVSGAQADPSSANSTSAAGVTVAATPAGKPVVRYRLYSPVTQEHHFTTDFNEYSVLGSQAGLWVREGAAGKVLDNPGTFNGIAGVPYYRLYNTATQWHHWTTDANEYYTLAQYSGWNAEGVDGYVLPTQGAGAVRLYRLLFPDGRGLHHWTSDANEYYTLTGAGGWIGEGGSGFVIE